MPNEICVICGSETDIDINTHVDFRIGYVEGCGQLCRDCYTQSDERQKQQEQDYISRVMRLRTQHITISAEKIMDTPNDQELGSYVRRTYHSIYNDRETQVENQWICHFCGRDTMSIEDDYLVGVDHLQCHLENQMKHIDNTFTFLK
jgi:hypothetical protein